MTFEPISIIHVALHFDDSPIPVGRLALHQREIVFEYTPDFIKSGLEISPFKLPLKAGTQRCDDHLFEGLFGVFNDSLPDGWGRLLLDRKLRQLGINPGNLSPLDRLRYVGYHGMGALVFEPEISVGEQPTFKHLDDIADEVYAVSEDDDAEFVDELLAMNGSSAGARPKIVVRLDESDWLIKFRSAIDTNDIGAIEYAYHLMADKAGLIVPEAKLFPSKKCPGYFGVKRFDRHAGQRTHMHTLSGLLHADHRIPSLDYKTILKATSLLSKNTGETEKQFRAAVFNVLSHNRDDHAKNFSFLMNNKGQWSVSPAYDLTFSSGPIGEHCTMVMGEGKHPTHQHLIDLANTVDIDSDTASDIIQEVQHAVSLWPEFANEAGVSKTSLQMVEKTLKEVQKSTRI